MGFDFGGAFGGVVGIIPGLAPRVSIPNPANGAVHVPGFPSRNPTGDYKPPTDPSTTPDGSYQPSNGNNTDKMVNMVVMYGGLAIGGYVVYRIVKKVL